MNAKNILYRLMLSAVLSASFSCAPRYVISDQIRSEAERAVSFQTLVNATTRYVGKTVILGGYIIETKPVAGETNMTVLQTPLLTGEKPDSMSRSQGGFILTYKGYLEPEVYEKNRRVTVAGKVVGRVTDGDGNCPNPCLRLEYRQIYRWPMYEDPSYSYYYGDEDFFPKIREYQ